MSHTDQTTTGTYASVKGMFVKRTPMRNRSYAVQFIVKGANKRRQLAYDRARDLQQEMGVLPALRCVK